MGRYFHVLCVVSFMSVIPFIILDLSGTFFKGQSHFKVLKALSGAYNPNVSADEIDKWQQLASTETRWKQGSVQTETRWKTFANIYRLTATNNGHEEAYVEISGGGVFLFSAVGLNTTASKYWDFYVINAWEPRKYLDKSYTCCLMYSDKTKQMPTIKKLSFKPNIGTDKSTVQGRQYVCRNPLSGKSRDVPKGISLVKVNQKCPIDKRFYLKPVTPDMPFQNSFVVCAKVVFGTMDANNLIEWIEYQKHFGVTKIVVYLSYDTHESAKRVLEHYKEENVVDVIPIGTLPMLDQKRDWGTKNNFENVAQDTAVILFDFQARCHSYTFGAVIDPDEFVVPKDGSKTFVKFMNGILRQKGLSRMASVKLVPEFHIKDWQTSNSSIPMMLTKYAYHSPPVNRSFKNFYVTSRVVHGTIATHSVTPKETYKQVDVDPKTAVLRHYRNCDGKFKDEEYERCVQGKHRVMDNEITRIASAIYPKVDAVRKKLGIEFT